jgi:hypothetical protein
MSYMISLARDGNSELDLKINIAAYVDLYIHVHVHYIEHKMMCGD